MVIQMKQTHKDIRKLWIIQLLLDGKRRTQKEITNELKNIGKKIEIHQNPLIQVSEAAISPIITSLDKKIIKKEDKIIQSTNIKANLCSIPQNLETFTNILLEIADSKISETRKSFFIRCLINSKYGTLFINDELIQNLLKHNNLPAMKLKDFEKKFITKMLRASPQALNYLNLSISNKGPEYKQSDAKQKLLIMLQTFLNLDLIDPFTGIMYSAYPHKISFKTTVSFSSEPPTKDETNYPDLKIGIKENHLESTIDHTSYAKKINLDMIIEAYLKTYNTPDNPEYMDKL